MKQSFRMSRQEILVGGCFLIFQLTLLPLLLDAACDAVSFSATDARRNILYFAVSFLAVAGIFHRFLWRSAVQTVRQPGRVLVTVVAGLALYWVANLCMSLLLTALNLAVLNVNDRFIATMVAEEYPLMFIGTVLLVPLTEETLYRGLLFGCLYRKSKLLGYSLSTILFCAIHVMGYAGSYPADVLFACFLQYIPAGLCLGWAYARAETVFAPILIHALVNVVGILAMR